jgi:hypothetical protein
MATDTFGNYICNIEPLPAPYPPSGRCCRSGDGPPDDADGNNGQTYIDLLTGDLYVKANGVWTLTGAGGSEILAYTTTGPTADGVLPANLDGEAIAVKPGGSTFIWNSTLHVWDDV